MTKIVIIIFVLLYRAPRAIVWYFRKLMKVGKWFFFVRRWFFPKQIFGCGAFFCEKKLACGTVCRRHSYPTGLMRLCCITVYLIVIHAVRQVFAQISSTGYAVHQLQIRTVYSAGVFSVIWAMWKKSGGVAESLFLHRIMCWGIYEQTPLCSSVHVLNIRNLCSWKFCRYL